MDPNTALATMMDPTEQPDIRIGAAIALDEWMQRGGFTPDNVAELTGRRFDTPTAARLAVSSMLMDWRAGRPLAARKEG